MRLRGHGRVERRLGKPVQCQSEAALFRAPAVPQPAVQDHAQQRRHRAGRPDDAGLAQTGPGVKGGDGPFRPAALDRLCR